MKIMTGLLLAFVTFGTYAAEWTKAYEDAGVTIMVDRLSIQKSGDTFTVWQRVQYKGTASTPRISGKLVSYSVSRESFRCTDRSSANLTRVIYDAGGGVLLSSTSSVPIFSPVVPDTLGEAMLDVFCHS
ncbi:hypothetical protein U875_09525 [Pandoraea pnomenusa 3kgm]|nr:hypothetical protein U875_09525 [Pandoraea pnomenusa 3kgm]